MTTDTSVPPGAREAVLRAAQDLYAENGVAATTPRQVLARSGIGQGSLYHHFPSKRELAVAAVARTVAQTLASAAGDLEAEGAADERLEAYLSRPRDAVAGCRVGRLTADPFVMADDELRGQVAGYFSSLIDLVAAAFREQGSSGEQARDRAIAAVAVLQGGYVLSRALGDPSTMQSAVRGFLALLGPRR
ncbi:TetR/AcrR family transcriptional regulator [Microbacterium marinilacus]|nr:TetR/AcrR family transcriptional regulator [Microbacterium marinilacus]MBY0688504.1 TetR/AcrR family transcriptional regulator [Microbacterium marinilacus]